MAIIKGDGSDHWKTWQQRRTPRLVVPDELSIVLELEFGDDILWQAQCLDISLKGILVEFLAQQVPHVDAESKVLLTLRLNGEAADKIPGIVRHMTKRRMGILFPEPSTRTAEQEDRLRHIVRIVEREVLRQKTHGAFG